MDTTRLTEFLEPDGDAGLSADEILRYLDGTMEENERVEIEAFLAVSPVARFDLEDARRQRELEGRLPSFAASAPSPVRRPFWSWLMPLGLASGAALAAFFVGRAAAPAPVAERPAPPVTANREEAPSETKALQKERDDLRAALVASRSRLKASEDARKGGVKPDPNEANLRAQVTRLTALYSASLREADVAKREAEIAKTQARVAMRDPASEDAYDADTQSRMRKAVENRVERGTETPAPASSPTLVSPSPENASAGSFARLVLTLPAPSARVPYEWAVWRLRNDKPHEAIPVRTSVDGGRATLDLPPALPSGPYAVGVRALEVHPSTSEKERPWHAYVFRVLSPQEADRANAAHVYAARHPMETAMDLFDLDRLGEAAAILRAHPNVRGAKETFAGLEARIARAKRGESFGVDPGDLEDGAPATVPLDVAIQTAAPGDSSAALQALFDQAGKSPDYSNRMDLLGRAFDMAERLGLPERQTHAAFLLFIEFAATDKIADGEPYVERALATARKVLRAGDPNNPSSEPLAVLYFGGASYTRAKRSKDALAPLEEGEAYARSGRNDFRTAHLTFEHALACQDLGRLPEAVAGWRDTLGLLAKVKAANIPAQAFWCRDSLGAAEARLAECLYQLEDLDGALGVCNDAFQNPLVMGDAKIIVLKMRASVKIERGGDADVMTDLNAAKSLYSPSTAPDVKADVEIAYGIYFLKRGSLTDARSHLNYARELADLARRPDMVHTVDVCLDAVALLEAKGSVLDRVSPVNSGLDSPVVRMVDLQRDTERLLAQRRWSEAETAAQEVIDLARTNGFGTSRVFNLTDLAWAKSQQGRYDDALPDFEAARHALAQSMDKVEPERMGAVQQRSATGLYAQYAWTLWKRERLDDASAVLNGGRAMGLRAKRGDGPRDERIAVRRAIDARPGTLFLQFAPLDDDRSLLLVSSAHAPTQGFEILIGALRLASAIKNWGVDSSASDPGYERRVAQGLGSALLGEVERKGLLDPKRFPHLVVVGDGLFQRVPFAALIDGSGKRVIERFTVGYAVALGLELAPASGLRPMLGVAYAGGGAGTEVARGTLGEAQDVKGDFPGVTLLQGADAKVATAKREMGRYRVLLFSSHGEQNLKDPLDSSLVLAPNGGEDGKLTAREVAAMRLRADLAVLSGCQTATGEPVGGDGPMGMSWAFQAAGCGSVVGTVWDVNDATSRMLVAEFFRGLKAGKGKDESLRAAQLKIMRNPQRSHPYYWAGFRLVGDPRPIRF